MREKNGKTTTVLELQETSQGVSAEKVLRVLYEVHCEKVWKTYRRAKVEEGRRSPQEQENQGQRPEWQDIEYTRLRKRLPNKVADWIGGKSIVSLVKCTRSTKSKEINSEKINEMLKFERMQEECNAEGSLLWVCYATQREYKWYSYTRAKDGGIGFEGTSKDQSKKCIIYSEYFKSLKSPHLDKPLPFQVFH